MDNLFVLVNPVSANGTTAKVWPEIEEELNRRTLRYTSHLTAGVGDATAAVRQALKQGATTVISVGGDGTVNETVNGFFEQETPINPAAKLGIISRGTGCDLIKTLGIPKDYKSALDLIETNQPKPIDLALMEFQLGDGTLCRRYYINIADAGLGAVACIRVNNTTKAKGGMLSYLTGTLGTLFSYKNRWARIEADGKEIFDGPVVLAAVANGRYFGGGMHLAPIAEIDDGKLDLILVKGMGKPSLLANLARIYRGTHLSHPRVSTLPASEVVIGGDHRQEIEMDGETPGYTPATVWVRPNAIQVLF